MRLHIHIVLAPLGSDTRVEGNTHGYWIWERNTVFPGLDFVSFARTAIALDSKAGKIGYKSQDLDTIAVVENSVSAGQLPTDKLHRKSTKQDNTSSFGIDPDVVFGGWRHVSFAAGSTSHNQTAGDFGSNFRPLRQRQGEIGEGSQRHQYDSKIRFDSLDDRIGGVRFSRRFTGRRVIVISQSVATMKPGCALMHSKQRFFSTGINRDIGSAEFNCVERVPGGLLNINISGDCRDCCNLDVGCAKSHDDRHGVVGGGVGIDQE